MEAWRCYVLCKSLSALQARWFSPASGHSAGQSGHGHKQSATVGGLCCRPDGLFPPGDALLAELGAQAGARAFEKHLAGRNSPHELLARGSWTSGNAAALAGLDLRLFYQVSPAPLRPM